MPASTSAEICRIFREAMAAGDIERVLSVYDPEVVFLDRSGREVNGKQSLRAELAPLVQARADFVFDIRQIVEADGIALMHTHSPRKARRGQAQTEIRSDRAPPSHWQP